MPNDEKEQERLDFMHHIFIMTLGGRLQLAPIDEKPQLVLDVGISTTGNQDPKANPRCYRRRLPPH
ncbi:hypothetical protein BJ878DRAFT_426207 [Calycina marina]|uniref:Uncharacterized protein n=1 Tax=Calycina marina TaxID=1763456 RepID=A0A9P7YYZ7_9HELO|nr:hypothetical protein BJ878DRAFT_426207 [Calycina marina]